MLVSRSGQLIFGYYHIGFIVRLKIEALLGIACDVLAVWLTYVAVWALLLRDIFDYISLLTDFLPRYEETP